MNVLLVHMNYVRRPVLGRGFNIGQPSQVAAHAHATAFRINFRVFAVTRIHPRTKSNYGLVVGLNSFSMTIDTVHWYVSSLALDQVKLSIQSTLLVES
jgi:hypothetical protein